MMETDRIASGRLASPVIRSASHRIRAILTSGGGAADQTRSSAVNAPTAASLSMPETAATTASVSIRICDCAARRLNFATSSS